MSPCACSCNPKCGCECHAAERARCGRLRAALSAADRQLVYWWDTRHTCPCGARPESPDTHPHAPACPTARALQEASDE